MDTDAVTPPVTDPADPAPPVAPRRSSTRVLHGVETVDDYAWMADHSDPALVPYLEAERAFHDVSVADGAALRAQLYAEMAARVPAVDRSAPWEQGGFTYDQLVPEGAELGVFRRRPAGAPEEEALVLLDLDAMAAEGGSTYLELGVREVSPGGGLLAYSVDLDGDEVYELRVRDLTTGQDLPERVPHTYYGAAWSADGRDLFYVVHDHAYRPYQVWRHRIGTPVADDALVLQEDDRRFEVEVRASRSGEWVVIRAASRDTAEVWLIPAADAEAPPISLAGRRRGHEYDVEPLGGRGLLVVTNLDGATEFRAMRADVGGRPGPESWVPVGEYKPNERLVGADAFAGFVVLTLRRAGEPVLRVVPTDGSAPFEIRPDQPTGTVELGRNEDWDAGHVTVVTQSRVRPPVWWDVRVPGGARTLRHRHEAPGYDPEGYVSQRRWARSPDGERVPLTVVRSVDVPLDGSAPCLLYGYGAYEYVYEPHFDPALVSLLDRGVVFVHAGIRGGGEMGRRWWDGGHLAAKANSFVDLVAAADHLAGGVVDGTRIVSRGGSAGGLLVAASMGRAPRRFRGVVAEVPFVDCVNSMLNAELPLTVNEWDEWGDPSIPEQAGWMLAYSPYENLPAADERPAILVTGALHDPRVLVHEPAKWTAALRATDPAAGVPAGGPYARGSVLFRCTVGEGSHGGAAGRYAHLQEEAETQAWVLSVLDGH
ncbi:MAG: prolyl oligopeptidase family serine peptidase [Candidatus Nanopelagicales bacterium]